MPVPVPPSLAAVPSPPALRVFELDGRVLVPVIDVGRALGFAGRGQALVQRVRHVFDRELVAGEHLVAVGRQDARRTSPRPGRARPGACLALTAAGVLRVLELADVAVPPWVEAELGRVGPTAPVPAAVAAPPPAAPAAVRLVRELLDALGAAGGVTATAYAALDVALRAVEALPDPLDGLDALPVRGAIPDLGEEHDPVRAAALTRLVVALGGARGADLERLERWLRGR